MEVNKNPETVSNETMKAMKLQCDEYKEKLDHMKIYIKELKNELQSMKIRCEGVETISKLLAEAKQEIATLQRQKKTLETLIRNLQNRLASSGISNNVTFSENELFIPDTSKQILDNLAKENARLRNMLGSPSELGGFKTNSMLQETVNKLSEENADLEEKINNLNKKIADLENSLSSSLSEKDKEIAKLNEEIKKYENDSQIQNILCHSMSGEIGNLRDKLHNFVIDCQTLEMTLEESEQKMKKQEESVNDKLLPKTVILQENNENQEDYKAIKEENKILQEKLDEVTEMNKRWQEYDSGRQKYIQELNCKIGSLEDTLKKALQNQMNPVHQQKINELLQTASEDLRREKEEKLKLKSELEYVRNQNQRLMEKKVINEDTATIEALKAQIQICTEDFETERMDREKAQNIICQVKAELQRVTAENLQLRKQRQVQPIQNRGFSNMSGPHPYTSLSNDVKLQARGISTDGNVTDGHETNPSPKFHDMGPMSLPVTKSALYPNQTLSLKTQVDDLCCPKCSMGFSEAEQDKLLEHMEMCCE